MAPQISLSKLTKKGWKEGWGPPGDASLYFLELCLNGGGGTAWWWKRKFAPEAKEDGAFSTWWTSTSFLESYGCTIDLCYWTIVAINYFLCSSKINEISTVCFFLCMQTIGVEVDKMGNILNNTTGITNGSSIIKFDKYDDILGIKNDGKFEMKNIEIKKDVNQKFVSEGGLF